MDSDDEDDEFCLDEVEDVQRTIVYQGGKLNDILAEVETRIPSLDFDEEFGDDDHNGSGVFTCGNEPVIKDCTSNEHEKNISFLPNEITETPVVLISSEFTQTNSIEKITPDEITQKFDNKIADSVQLQKAQNIGASKVVPVTLDFNKLQEIDFHAVKSALCNFTSLENFLFDASFSEFSNEKQPSIESCESDLMERLTDFSKDQINSSVSANVEISEEKKLKHDRHQDKRHSFGNFVSTKAIHSWTQLKEDGSSSEQPETVFLDLRSERKCQDAETVAPKHISSIQRILGLTAQRSASSSEDDSDSELADWREMRNKHKEKVFREKESFEKRIDRIDRKKTKKINTSRKKEVNTLKTNKKCSLVAEVSEEELVGGIPNETVDNNRKSQIKVEPTSSALSQSKNKPTEHKDNIFTKTKDITKLQYGTSIQAEILSHNEYTKYLSSSTEGEEKEKHNKQCSTDNLLTLKKGNELINSAQQTRFLVKKDNVSDGIAVAENNHNHVNFHQGRVSRYQENDASDTGQVLDMIENKEVVKGGQKSSDKFSVGEEVCRETTKNDINRLVASAVRMLDEVYDTRQKLEKECHKNTACYVDILNSVDEECAPLDEKNGASEEKYEVELNEETRTKLFTNALTQTEDNSKINFKKRRGLDNCRDLTFAETLTENNGITIYTDVLHKNELPNPSKVPDDVVDDNTEDTKRLPHHKAKIGEDGGTYDYLRKTKQQQKMDIPTYSEGIFESRTPQVNLNAEEKNGLSSLFHGDQNQRNLKEIKQLKQKVKENIESMRPTRSANGKYPAAFNTPIIYDQQSSYESECRSLLPVAAEERLTLLLVVTLFTCGELNLRLKSKTPATLTGVNDYFALLAWLLSLDGEYNSDNSVPFSLVSMQQAYQNGKIQLFVGVRPRDELTEISISGKTTKKNRNRAFNRAISKYLSTRSLRDVYQKMGRIYLGDKSPVEESFFSSKMLSTYITVGQDPNAVQRVFESKTGFFWQTVEVPDSLEVFPCDESSSSVTSENTVVLVQPSLYHRPSCILDLLSRVENEGCDLAGLRLAYNETFEPNYDYRIVQSRHRQLRHPSLALAFRGPAAISKIKTIIGSKIPVLDAPNTVPSLRSLYCTSLSEDKLFYCPSYSTQATVLLARWFGGRVADKEINAGEMTNSESHSPLSEVVPMQIPPALLISSTRVAFYLICSSLMPPNYLGWVLYIANLRGFSVHSIRRMYLNKRQGNNLGFSQLQQAVFCAPSINSSHQSPNQSPPSSPTKAKVAFNFESSLLRPQLSKRSPSTVIVLQRENGFYHAKTLVKHIYETLLEWKRKNREDVNQCEENAWQYFYTIQFNEASCKFLMEDVSRTPDSSLIKQARNHCFWSNSEIEQVCVLFAATSEAFAFIGLVLKILYSDDNHVPGNWELLAINSFSSLNLIQAREVTPLEVGDHLWETNVKRLMSTTVIACVLRGINIIQRLCDFMVFLSKMSTFDLPDVDWWISQTTEVAFRQIVVLFNENEMFSDENCRTSTKYLPPPRKKITGNSSDVGPKVLQKKKQRVRPQKQEEWHKTITGDTNIEFCELSVIQSLLVGSRPITTVAVIKPCCLSNTKNLGKIFKSICQENFKIVALKISVLNQSEAKMVVQSDEEDVNESVNYLTSGASLLMCLQRENAVKKFLDMLGPGDPVIARSLDPFLLRGCYGVDPIHNAIHGSKSYSNSVCEIKTLFPCGLCCGETVDLEADQIACRAFDETIGKSEERKITKRLEGFIGIAQSLVSSLVQTNCLVLTQHIIYDRSGRQRIALVDVLECLLSLNFIPVGMKLAFLTQEQIENCFNLVNIESRRRQKMKNELTQGPCIVTALQRDNAITCFDTIIESAPAKYRSLEDYREYIIQGATEDEAKNLLLYFFEELTPTSAEEICSTKCA